jgi:hypothetical protein
MISRIIYFTFLTLLFNSLFLLASESGAKESKSANPALSLSLQIDKKLYSSGALIKLKVVFKNNSKKNILLNVYDINHRLYSGLLFMREQNPKNLNFKCFEKRKMPIVTKEDFKTLTSEESSSFEISI